MRKCGYCAKIFTMSIWFAIPSKRPPEQAKPILNMWRAQGYKLALWRDDTAFGPEWTETCGLDALVVDEYPGYAKAVNYLVRLVLIADPEAEWIVTGGDDVQPDMGQIALQIGASCTEHFNGTFGVMQPTGDRWGDHRGNTHAFEKWPEKPHRCIHCGQEEDTPPHMHGAYIDRVCGSPWMGREFCLQINQGKGPLWPEYFHMGEDEELQAVAKKYGVLWQRPDLIHLHKHWGRSEPGRPLPSADQMPDFLKDANSLARWKEYKALFKYRKGAGFPGSEPL